MRIGVVGAGIIGLATTHELLDGDDEVRCYETSVPLGARSAGDTRIFRLAHSDATLVEHAMRGRPAPSSTIGLEAPWSAPGSTPSRRAAGERAC
jgi:sarcosine oxidase